MKIHLFREVSTKIRIAIVLILAAALLHSAQAVEGEGSSSKSKGSVTNTPEAQSTPLHSKPKVSKSQSIGVKQVTAKNALPLVLKQQADCWNAGDLDGFMQSYLDSPRISYTSSGETVHGFEALKRRYTDKYGSKKDTMGELSFSELSITELGANDALCVGSWHLERAGQPNIDGVFTLIFTKTPEGWKIIHDHTSAKVAKPQQ